MTQSYIGTKQITAWPETKLIGGDNVASDGYAVKYPDGYISWSPKDVFEKAYLPMGEGNTNKITEEMVTDFIKTTATTTLGTKTTIVHCELVNGFIITEASSCVDPANYDKELGEKICMDRIKSKVWELLGFLLQMAVSGVK